MTNGKVHHRVLSDEQLEWLRRWFPKTENTRLRKAMGISDYKLHDFARKLGLTKSEAGLKAIRKRRDKAAAKTNELNGCYARKRGHRPSDATMEGVRRRWEETKQGLRELPAAMLKRTNPKKYNEWMKRKSQERKETIRKEKMRVMYGLERKTRLKAVVMTPYTRSQIAHRYNALKRGYLLDEDCSEGQPGRYIIYFDNETKRSKKFEENCIADGLIIKKDD